MANKYGYNPEASHDTGFGLVPNNVKVRLRVEDAPEDVSSNRSNWKALKFKLKVVGEVNPDGSITSKYKNRVIFKSICYSFVGNEKVAEIGQSQLHSLVTNGKVNPNWTDPREFVGCMVDGTVSIQKDKTGQYEDQNDIRFFDAIPGYDGPARQQFEQPANDPWGAPAGHDVQGGYDDDLPF